MPIKIEKDIVKAGNGDKPKPGAIVHCHYTAFLENDPTTIIHTSRNWVTPFFFQLSAAKVITGFEKALSEMSVGEIAKVRIPPKYGYGADGARGVPPNSTLLFDIELVKVEYKKKY